MTLLSFARGRCTSVDCKNKRFTAFLHIINKSQLIYAHMNDSRYHASAFDSVLPARSLKYLHLFKNIKDIFYAAGDMLIHGQHCARIFLVPE